MKKIIATFIVFSSLLSNMVFAQEAAVKSLAFGNQGQPGTRVHEAIETLMTGGETLLVASESVVNGSVSETSELLSAKALQAVSGDKPSTLEFIRNMVTLNNLFEATKATIESIPESIVNIINVTVALYPDYAQDVINAAVMSGEMDSDQALLAAITAGADPTSVGEVTTAGDTLAQAISAPVGVGVGAGGTGGGDATASTN